MGSRRLSLRLLLPVTETIFDIGNHSDEHDAEQGEQHDRNECRRHFEGIGLEIDEVAQALRRHEKFRNDNADDGPADAGSQAGERSRPSSG
jgi:hypothetical protein